MPINDKYQPNYLRSKVHLNLAKAYKNIKEYKDAKLNAEVALRIANAYDFPIIKLQSTQIIYKTKLTKQMCYVVTTELSVVLKDLLLTVSYCSRNHNY